MRTATLGLLSMTLGAFSCGPPPVSMPDMAIAPDVVLAKPDHGFQLATDSTPVPSGQELQACYFFKAPDLNNGQPYYVNKIEVAQNVGSHHMNLFRQGTVAALKGPNADGTGKVEGWNGMGPCFKPSSNWADWPLIVNSQIPSQTKNGATVNYVLDLSQNEKKDNVAYKFTPGEMLMMQSHFVNATTQTTPGRAFALVNLYQDMDASNLKEVGTLFATEQSISICKAKPTPEFTGYCHINTHNQPVTILAANGHFHSRGKNFTIQTWDGMNTDPTAGTKFYQSSTWDEPPMATGLNVAVPTGTNNVFGGVSWTCGFQWAPSPACADGCSCLKDPVNCCYGFGPVVETSEHCNAFVYYYPKLDKTDINCQ